MDSEPTIKDPGCTTYNHVFDPNFVGYNATIVAVCADPNADDDRLSWCDACFKRVTGDVDLLHMSLLIMGNIAAMAFRLGGAGLRHPHGRPRDQRRAQWHRAGRGGRAAGGRQAAPRLARRAHAAQRHAACRRCC